ncbi:hypothetical protein [uncultured Cellulomonas sp.]|uniref:hypothetical protein n=1 Tax=uncultured Cellulomonas sp. TaxID=189682 RepID=UPI0028E35446|nr:hypothetical protein [uncultured Cellulomonas sp.]
MSVRGAGPIAALCLRCLVVLAAVNGALLLALQGIRSPSVVSPSSLYISFLALLVTAVVIGLAGFPFGVLIGHLLRNQPRERVHVIVFAVVGAVLSVTICAMWNLLSAVPWYALVAAAEGAVGAGVARWWTGRVHARRASWTDEQGAALPWGKIAP